MPPRRPSLCVITPRHHGAAFVGECTESVLAQTYDNFEYSPVKKLRALRRREGSVLTLGVRA